MNAELYRRARDVFVRAIELEPRAREPFLDSECAGDPVLRTEVASLLTAHEQRRGFDSVPRAPEGSGHPPLEAARFPAHIGPYRILDVLGEGGMGIVYLAEQESPRRLVALKVLPPWSSGPDRLRRFRRESEILGRLNHPGIAQIYEAGTFEWQGAERPFFAMELVRGDVLSEHASEHSLDIPARLRLLVQVAKAVHYAHEQGIVHRDLKPANILVDGAGVPKVLDFGIALSTDEDWSRTSVERGGTSILGTLPYMSPEQLGPGEREIDAQSDVYALGVIAYEVLSGRLPFDVGGCSISEAVVLLTCSEPRRLGTLDRTLRGDLEAIVAKAMEKDGSRRYATAEDFAADIDRYLHGEPIRARRATALYQISKFARRNKILVAGLLATLFALSGGLYTTDRAAVRAENQTRVAEKRLEQVFSVYQFLDHMLTSSDPDELGRDAKLVDYLGRAAADLDAQVPADPLIEALLRYTIGTSYAQIGQPRTALPHLDRALELYESLKAADSDEWIEDSWANTALDLGEVLATLGDYERAESLMRPASALLERRMGTEAFHLSEASRHLPRVFMESGKPEEAVALLREILATHERALGPQDLRTLDCMQRLAEALDFHKEYAESLDLLLHIRSVESQAAPLPPSFQGTLMRDLGVALYRAGRTQEALAIMREALDLFIEHFSADHPYTLNTLENQAMILSAIGQVEEAIAQFEEVIDRRALIEGEADPNRLRVMIYLASMLSARGRREEALPLLDEVVALIPSCPLGDGPSTIRMRISIASLWRSLGREDEAVALADASLRLAGDCNPRSADLIEEIESFLGRAFRDERAGEESR